MIQRILMEWKWHHSAALIAALVIVPMLYAGGLVERDQRRLDRAKEAHAQEIERALEIYTTRVERANDALDRVYTQLITRYEQRGERHIAEELRRDRDELIRSALDLGDQLNEAEETANAHRELIQSIGPTLVDANDGSLDSTALHEANYVVLFFSAQWCGPCRTFTPELVQFHRRHSQRGKVAVIYVSSDCSENQMMRYLRDSNMPWHAVPYDRVEASGLKQRFNVRGIPRLVVLDREGETVLESGGRRNPSQVLRELADRL